MSPDPTTLLVVPCYNESERLDTQAFSEFVQTYRNTSILFVNDGSTDATEQVLASLSRQSDRMHTLDLERNGGKAEAVRLGMLWSVERNYDFAGYLDADLSTPLHEISNLIHGFGASEIDIVTAARIKMVGRNINRNPFRHYSGRAFATAVSLLFGIEMYDTQCGAKLFRTGDYLEQIFRAPFITRWVFDVELFVRFSGCPGKSVEQNLVEVPLTEWRDVSGSKMRPGDFLKAPLELLKIHHHYFGSS